MLSTYVVLKENNTMPNILLIIPSIKEYPISFKMLRAEIKIQTFLTSHAD